MDITKTAIEFTSAIPQADQVNKLLELIQPLVKDETDQPAEQQSDQVCFQEDLLNSDRWKRMTLKKNRMRWLLWFISLKPMMWSNSSW